jgi:MSHA biogenesis protein MshL
VQLFNAIVSGTRYSMLVHASVTGNISINLKDVTIAEALAAIRDLYGYEYRIDGSRILVQAPVLQTRVFRVNYLPGERRGASDLRVQSGSVSDAGVSGVPPVQATAAAPVPGTLPGLGGPSQAVQRALESTRVSTEHRSDFWRDLRSALLAIIGPGEGRDVVVTPQSGVVVVRAMPRELRVVENYLRETRIAVERQVMLEAKVIAVTLADAFHAGINWAAFRTGGTNAAVGQVSNVVGATRLAGRLAPDPTLSGTGQTFDLVNRALTSAGSAALAATSPAGAVFGLALQTSNFAALLLFLESHGTVQVLSSPRIATLNNQKAVLKVGTDEFFVTNVSTVTTVTGNATQQTPTVTVAPFFSGIMLDVTPQIDDNDNITLHIHPSISEVTESRRIVDLGGTVPSITLPLAKSKVSETDAVVRASNGNIVVIGGLMSVDLRDDRGGIPGVSDGFSFLRNTDRRMSKQELVILLKPTIIHGDRAWQQDIRETRERMQNIYPAAPAGEGRSR